MAEFNSVRAKAQEMLVEKDGEIKRLKDKTIAGRKVKNPNNSGIDSDDDALSQVYKSDQSSSEDDDELTAPKSKPDPKQSINSVEAGGDHLNSTNRVFLKTVLLKYLECMANQQDKECKMMEKVLFTALKVHEVELKKIEEARLKALNSGIMGYFWAAEGNVVAKPVKPRAVNPNTNSRYRLH